MCLDTKHMRMGLFSNTVGWSGSYLGGGAEERTKEGKKGEFRSDSARR